MMRKKRLWYAHPARTKKCLAASKLLQKAPIVLLYCYRQSNDRRRRTECLKNRSYHAQFWLNWYYWEIHGFFPFLSGQGIISKQIWIAIILNIALGQVIAEEKYIMHHSVFNYKLDGLIWNDLFKLEEEVSCFEGRETCFFACKCVHSANTQKYIILVATAGQPEKQAIWQNTTAQFWEDEKNVKCLPWQWRWKKCHDENVQSITSFVGVQLSLRTKSKTFCSAMTSVLRQYKILGDIALKTSSNLDLSLKWVPFNFHLVINSIQILFRSERQNLA